MNTFLWFMVVIMSIYVIGKAVMLWEQDFIRKPQHMICDMAIAVAILAWSAWLLGSGV